MDAMCHFKYDREITLWLAGFMGRALPGACFPDKVAYGIHEREACDAYMYDLSMSLPLSDGCADIDVTMEIWLGPRPFDDAEPGPSFFNVRATRDVLDVRGFHVRTLRWDDEGGVWLTVEPDAEDEDV